MKTTYHIRPLRKGNGNYSQLKVSKEGETSIIVCFQGKQVYDMTRIEKTAMIDKLKEAIKYLK